MFLPPNSCGAVLRYRKVSIRRTLFYLLRPASTPLSSAPFSASRLMPFVGSRHYTMFLIYCLKFGILDMRLICPTYPEPDARRLVIITPDYTTFFIFLHTPSFCLPTIKNQKKHSITLTIGLFFYIFHTVIYKIINISFQQALSPNTRKRYAFSSGMSVILRFLQISSKVKRNSKQIQLTELF